jgi:hypothetical protein
MNSIDQHATRMRRAIGIGLLLFLIAAPAQANRIVQVRVGSHPTFTRLVFEMDGFTGYQVERRAGTDGAEQLTVTLEASTRSREITSKSVGIESVQIAEGIGQAIAQIRLRKSGLQMKEMILSNPPRIVLDFVYAATAVAERTGDPDAKPTPVEPPVREEPPLAAVRPAPKPAVAEVVEPTPQDAPVDPTPSPEEIAMMDPTADSPADEIAGAEPTDEQIADAADADRDAPLGSPARAVTPSTDEAQRRVPSPSDVTRRIGKPKSADSGLPFNTVTLAGIAVGALIVLVVAVRLFRRRSLPNDLDVTTFEDAPDDDAAALDRETSDRIPAEGFSMDDSPTDGPTPQVEEQNTAAYSLSEVAAEATEPETGLYDEDSEGEKPMDMETANLPTERDNFGTPPAAVMSGGDNDMSQLVQELAGRIANLETRLDEANDCRERLERQVAAQSEELRVQRAAIARTQRALRSLSRSEEDQATEPALREPSQPAS